MTCGNENTSDIADYVNYIILFSFACLFFNVTTRKMVIVQGAHITFPQDGAAASLCGEISC